MIFYKDKFKQIRKQHRWSLSALAQKSNISRMSLSMWENGKLVPSEKKVRALARFLNISVSEISDMPKEQVPSINNLSDIAETWFSLAEFKEDVHNRMVDSLFNGINGLDKRLRQSSIIINALISSIHAIFYVKDTNQKYIVANKEFLNNFSMGTKSLVLGKEDKDFFSAKEAKKNYEEDRNVLLTGKAVIDKENYIPGTRKKEWGLISKIPILDLKGNIAGIVGTIVNITERKIAEGTRIALDKAINKLDECIWVAKLLDLEKNKYKIVYLNDAIEKMSGVKKEEFFKNSELWTEFIHPIFKEKVLKARESKKFPRYYEYKSLRQGSKEEYWREDVTYKDGDMLLGIAKDVTSLVKGRESTLKKNNIKIAKRLKTQGVDSSIILKATGVSDEDIINHI